MPRFEHARISTRVGLAVLATAAWCLAGAALGPPSARPTGAKPLSATVTEDSLQLFKDKDFKDNMTQIGEVTSKASWRAIELEGKSDNKVSSVRWNLPRGVVVSLNETETDLARPCFSLAAAR